MRLDLIYGYLSGQISMLNLIFYTIPSLMSGRIPGKWALILQDSGYPVGRIVHLIFSTILNVRSGRNRIYGYVSGQMSGWLDAELDFLHDTECVIWPDSGYKKFKISSPSLNEIALRLENFINIYDIVTFCFIRWIKLSSYSIFTMMHKMAQLLEPV